MTTHTHTHTFARPPSNQLQHRWSRGRSKERRGRSPHNGDAGAHGGDDSATDYAADNSSDHSSSATQSPRHRATTIGGSPLARPNFLRRQTNDSTSLHSQKDLMQQNEGHISTSQPLLDTMQVSVDLLSSSKPHHRQGWIFIGRLIWSTYTYL